MKRRQAKKLVNNKKLKKVQPGRTWVVGMNKYSKSLYKTLDNAVIADSSNINVTNSINVKKSENCHDSYMLNDCKDCFRCQFNNGLGREPHDVTWMEEIAAIAAEVIADEEANLTTAWANSIKLL